MAISSAVRHRVSFKARARTSPDHLGNVSSKVPMLSVYTRFHLPSNEIGVDTETGSVSVGPSEVTVQGLSRSPGRGVVGELEHDLGDSDRVGPRTVSYSITRSDRV